MKKELLVCSPSGKDSFGLVLYFLALIAIAIFLIIKGFSNPYQWLWLLLIIPGIILYFFLLRYEFFGEEIIGIEDNDLIIRRVKCLPFVRDIRIPRSEIKEVGIPRKSKLDEVLEIINELNMYPIDESTIEITTINGKTYHFGDDLAPQDVKYFISQLAAEIAKM